MDTNEIERLKVAAEEANNALSHAVDAQRKDAIKKVKDLIKTFNIKEREVKVAFPKTKTRKPRMKS